jgi:hypothetical protein
MAAAENIAATAMKIGFAFMQIPFVGWIRKHPLLEGGAVTQGVASPVPPLVEGSFGLAG